ncbi:hypothetical protein D3Z52_06260 [Clostridiaceae bacterium]|nr:hypothetical protein [Clostridiaceae bacterium]
MAVHPFPAQRQPVVQVGARKAWDGQRHIGADRFDAGQLDAIALAEHKPDALADVADADALEDLPVLRGGQCGQLAVQAAQQGGRDPAAVVADLDDQAAGSVMSPVFLTAKNIMSVGRQVSVTGILAFAETILIIGGNVDLSLGSQVALSGMISINTYLATGSAAAAFASAVIGGASFTGGTGTAAGTLVGAFVVGFISNILNLKGVSIYVQQIIKGILIIIAVSVDIAGKNRKIRQVARGKKGPAQAQQGPA